MHNVLLYFHMSLNKPFAKVVVGTRGPAPVLGVLVLLPCPVAGPVAGPLAVEQGHILLGKIITKGAVVSLVALYHRPFPPR